MITKEYFGKTSKNEDVFLYTISKNDLILKVSNYGATIVSLITKDKHNTLLDIVLGYDNASSYEQQTNYIGATIGRCCNRISDAKFYLNKKTYHLTQNENKHHLHGGYNGFNKKIWDATIIDDNTLKLTTISPDGEEGYPGKLTVSIIYKIKKQKIYIDYYAKSNKDTICNLTNHTYFNLNGYNSEDILNQEIQIFADKFSEDNDCFLPTGNILSVKNTPLNLQKRQVIGKNINNPYYQLKNAKGFNVNYILKKKFTTSLTHFATAYASKSGIMLKAYTNMPCFEFYTGGFLSDKILGKNNTPIKKYGGFCLEPQFAPNAINMPNFIKPILKKNKLYFSRTIFEITTLK